MQPPSGGPGRPHGPTGYSIGDAFSYGWSKFQQHLGPVLLGTFILMVGGVLVSFVWDLLISAIFPVDAATPGTRGGSGSFFGFLVGSSIGALGSLVVQVFIQAAITRGGLSITDGRRLDLSTLFDTDQLPQVLLGAVLIGIAGMIGLILCIIPGLIVFFFTQFFVHFAIDKRLSAIDAIKASVSFVNAHLGTLVGFYLALIAALIVGALLCVVGLLAAVPIVVIAQAYTYRRLLGEPVVA